MAHSAFGQGAASGGLTGEKSHRRRAAPARAGVCWSGWGPTMALPALRRDHGGHGGAGPTFISLPETPAAQPSVPLGQRVAPDHRELVKAGTSPMPRVRARQRSPSYDDRGRTLATGAALRWQTRTTTHGDRTRHTPIARQSRDGRASGTPAHHQDDDGEGGNNIDGVFELGHCRPASKCCIGQHSSKAVWSATVR